MINEQLYQQLIDRYEAIVKSGDNSKMEQLGDMVKRVFRWLCRHEPEVAEQALDILGNDDCYNYLSEPEARNIVSHMQPAPRWTLDDLVLLVHQNNYMQADEPPYYNEWALLTTMCMLLSDSGETLSEALGMPGHQASSEELLAVVYRLALDKLKDKDKMFNIRKYFNL